MCKSFSARRKSCSTIALSKAQQLFYYSIRSGVWRDIAAAFGVGSIMNIAAMPSRHWEQKAKEARDKARVMACVEAKALMRDVARRYQLMARIASARISRVNAQDATVLAAR